FWSRYFRERTHVTIVLTSASGTLLGGIGIEPQTPLPPAFTFCSSFAAADLSPAYFLAISLYPGPTTFLSTAWQPWQLYLAASCSALAASTAATLENENPTARTAEQT